MTSASPDSGENSGPPSEVLFLEKCNADTSSSGPLYSELPSYDRGLYDQLRPVDLVRLSLDFQSDSIAFSAAAKFGHKYSEQIEQLSQTAVQILELRATQASGQQTYSSLTDFFATRHKELGRRPTDERDAVEKVALAAAGKLVWKREQENRHIWETYQEWASQLSAAFVKHMTAAQPNATSIRLNGNEYFLNDGVLICRSKEKGDDPKKKLLAFTSHKEAMRIGQKYRSSRTLEKKSNKTVAPAPIEAWQQFFTDLRLVANY